MMRESDAHTLQVLQYYSFHALHDAARQTGATTMTGNQLSLGRNHSTADKASITSFGYPDPCHRVDLTWADGAHVSVIYDRKQDAVDHLARLGFVKPN